MKAGALVWLFITIVGGNGDPNSPSAIVTVAGRFETSAECERLRAAMKGDEWVIKTRCVPAPRR